MTKVEQKLQEYFKETADEYFEGDIEEAKQYIIDNHGEMGLRGYAIFTSDYTNAEHIERIDEMEIYDGDIDAAHQAKKDGIKLIPWNEQPHRYPYNCMRFIDTPENREVLKKETKEKWW